MNNKSLQAPEQMTSSSHGPDDLHAWPSTLRCAYEICQQSKVPMSIYRESDARLFYNDAWSALLDKSSRSSGNVALDIYQEQWKVVQASITRVISSGESARSGRNLFGQSHDRSHDGCFNYMLQRLNLENGEYAVLIIAERSYEEVEKYHDEFLATIAHELRNPFGALAAAAQVLNRAIDRPQMMATARDALTRQIGYLAQLLDDLLLLSRLRRGRLELRHRPAALTDIIAAAVQASRATMESRQHNFVVEESPASITINGDEPLLTRMLAALLNHIAKHTEPGRLLQLQTRIHENNVDVIISNTGFAPELIQSAIGDCLQRKFTRKLGKDLDISLYLICGLVQLHGGHISAQRDSAGNGTDFTVSLPCIPPP